MITIDLSLYGLAFDPFDKNNQSVSDSFESRDQKEMMKRLNYLAEVRGVGVFTAAPGMGKSYTMHRFQKELNENLYSVKYICLSTVTVSEFYKQLCSRLAIPTSGGKTEMFKNMQTYIYRLYKDKKKTLIIIIDEAQYLKNSVLFDLKMLMNFVYDSINCFTLILSGESHLNNTLEQTAHEALRQRIVTHYDFQGLSSDEISAYVYHKLKLANGYPELINEEALFALAGYCRGNPRIIDKVMSTALRIGADLKHNTIDATLMELAINDQLLSKS